MGTRVPSPVEVPNDSDNSYLGDIVQTAISRRTMLKGTAGAALVVYTAGKTIGGGKARAANEGHGLTFTPIQPNTVDDLIVPNGYGYDVVLRWGDPIVGGVPEFDFENQSAAAQAKQSGGGGI